MKITNTNFGSHSLFIYNALFWKTKWVWLSLIQVREMYFWIIHGLLVCCIIFYALELFVLSQLIDPRSAKTNSKSIASFIYLFKYLFCNINFQTVWHKYSIQFVRYITWSQNTSNHVFFIHAIKFFVAFQFRNLWSL